MFLKLHIQDPKAQINALKVQVYDLKVQMNPLKAQIYCLKAQIPSLRSHMPQNVMSEHPHLVSNMLTWHTLNVHIDDLSSQIFDLKLKYYS